MSITSTITTINTHKPSSSSSSTHRITNGAQACAACKYQRRKCVPDCILAPYFPHDKQAQFLNAHKLFGVSNITKIIRDLKQREKDVAMETIILQSDMRARDPVGGCFGIVRALHYQIACMTNELEFVLQQIAACRAQQAEVYKNDHVIQEFNNEHQQNYQIMPVQYDQEYVNNQHQNEDDVSGSEVLNHNPPPPPPPQDQNAVQEFQYSWGSHDLGKEAKPLMDFNLGHEYVDITSFERGEESFKFDQQPIEKSGMMLKADNLGFEDEVEAFQQHQIPEHDLRSEANYSARKRKPENEKWEMEKRRNGIWEFEKSDEMVLKAETLGLAEEVEAFQQHQIPEHDLRSAATLFTLTS